MFDLGANKAPAPDGFPIIFSQKHWTLVQDVCVKLCNDFFKARANLESLNWVNIALISIATSVEYIND